MNRFIRIIFMLISFFFVQISTCIARLSPHDTIGQVQTNLTCLQCQTLDSGERCAKLPNDTYNIPKKICVGKENYCMVRRLSYFTSVNKTKKLWSVERGCVEKCIDGCVTVGEITKLFLCTSCCNDKNLCNIGNNAELTSPCRLHYIIISMVYYLLNRKCVKI